MKFINFCEKILDIEIKSLNISSDLNQLFKFGAEQGKYKYTFNDNDLTISLTYSNEKELDEEKLNILKELLESLLDFSELKILDDKWNCSEMLKSILENQPIEETIYQMIKALINNRHFKKIGVFFLNETLMRLKGVMYGEIDEIFKIENLDFKNVTIYLKEKNTLTDVLFYDEPKILSIKDINAKGLDNFFKDEIVACSLYSSTGPIGLIIGQRQDSFNYNLKYLNLFARICSIAIELTKTIKRLDFAIQDINYFKESLYASDSLVRIGKLAATVAHELKNPLVAIGGFVNRLTNIIEGEREQNYLKIISSEVYRLENIVTEILNYSKTLNVDKKELILSDILDEILELMNDKIQYYQISCYKDIDPDLKILADEIRVKQVFINIIDNAIQSMEYGGSLTISAEVNDNILQISIKDTGKGIPEDIINKIFEPFFTTKNKGTGLGLPLSKKIMLAHKGDIKIENYDSGVLVTLILPNN